MPEPEPPTPRVERIRLEIQETLARYFALEDELRHLESDRFRVCIFGSARLQPTDPTYTRVYHLARLLVGVGADIVTGGGPGLMEAANKGAREADDAERLSIGLPILLPRSQELANLHLDIKSEHQRFSSRLDEFMRLSHAVVVAPGGIGTLLELVYVWQLIQVGMVEPRPVVLLGREYWSGLVEWVRDPMQTRAFIGPRDLDWISCVDRPEEVLPLIQPELEKFRARQAAAPARERGAGPNSAEP
jgi:uncharacterized protein (TIGR00730 family)